ncbi:uncharacterized protein LOC134232863 [Saccostrea cucullata]|uniref:uncharacterized protein LOC134232863 n=1 Tax=Saccostrea cuccullata TaxID=36930 RepID=UPI002ED524B5
MAHIPRLSEILYVGLCCEIGTPTEVTIRRDVLDMGDTIDEKISKISKDVDTTRRMLSGSYREGFRFNTSDRDYMMWLCERYFLINDISQLRDYSSNLDIILMDVTDTPPGFVRLQLLTRPVYNFFTSAFVPLNDRIYISSFFLRQFFVEKCSSLMKYQHGHEHGPCFSGYLSGDVDIAFCFTCKYWPPQTNDWIERCFRHNWPPASVLKDILNNNYHCVAIGSNDTSVGNIFNWRFSFSLAEQKLVYSMNHTQFMCYGLLKIFLKEVINKNVEEPLLCSYFMKTSMFWLIQIGHVRWSPDNLLECFWKCLKYLILCVYRGKFANFFIPQNNLFINKIVGIARESLLNQLYQYYRMGVSCLQLSSTVRSILEPALSGPCDIQFSGRVCEEIGCVINDLQMLEELQEIVLMPCHFFLFLKSMDTLLNLSLSPYSSLTLQCCTADVLALTTFVILKYSSNSKNKLMYNLGKMLCNMLKVSARIGTISHSLYLALYYFRTGRYNKALNVSNLVKQRLSEHFILYYTTPVDRHRYSEEISHLSLSRKMKATWVVNLKFYYGIYFIEELILEQVEDKLKTPHGQFRTYPIFILVEMLSALSNYRLGNRAQYLQSLTDLHTLLLYDDGRYILPFHRDISWQILGICQQVVGDLHGALQSYQESLKQKSGHGTEMAAHSRIHNIRHQLSKNRRV